MELPVRDLFFSFLFFFCARHHTMSHIPPPSETADLDTISRPSPPHMSRLPLSFTPSLVFFCLSLLPSPYQPDPLCPEDPRHYIGSPASGHWEFLSPEQISAANVPQTHHILTPSFAETLEITHGHFLGDLYYPPSERHARQGYFCLCIPKAMLPGTWEYLRYRGLFLGRHEAETIPRTWY